MKVNTKLFGEIEIDEDKILTFDAGIVGFPDLTRFALMHDESDTEDGGNGLIATHTVARRNGQQLHEVAGMASLESVGGNHLSIQAHCKAPEHPHAYPLPRGH